MKYNLLPNTDIKVSRICLGTMTYGRQNTETDGHQQIDYALERGVNFIDTAEMYPVPAEATRYGNTERIIGTWIKKSKKRPLAFNFNDTKLMELITNRSKIYSKAKFKINCQKLSKNEITKKIITLYEKN